MSATSHSHAPGNTPRLLPADRPIRTGVIGAGLAMEKLHWPALAQLKGRFQIVAFSEPNDAAAASFCAYSGVPVTARAADSQSLLDRDDVEAVAILLPIPLLYAAARAALQAGKHVLCEKTPGVDLDQGRRFMQLEQDFPAQRLLVAENFFYRDDLRLARHLIDSGAIGRLNVMTWRMAGQHVPRAGAFSGTEWRQRPQFRGGAHLDGGVHMAAQIRLLCGDVRRIHGLAQHANTQMGGPSTVTYNLVFESGAIGSYTSIQSDIPLPRDREGGMRLYGSEATMTFTAAYGTGPRGVTIHRPRRDGQGTEPEEHRVENTDGGYYNEWRNFHDALVHGAPIVATVPQNWMNMQIVLRGLDAAETDTVIDLGDGAPMPLSATALPLWQPHGATSLFETLPCRVLSPAPAG